MLLDEIKNLLSLRKDGSLYHRERHIAPPYSLRTRNL